MPFITDPKTQVKAVLINGATVVWDGISQPEKMDDGTLKHTLKVVFPTHTGDDQLVNQLATECLRESEFKGVLPQGANWAISQVQAGEFQDLFPGHACVNTSTFRVPDVFDERGQKLNPMQYGQLIYSGQKVNAIVTCRAYNNKSRGVKCQLEGFQIVASANAPRLNLGGGGFNAASAFGAPAAQQPVNYGQPAQQPVNYGQPAQQPVNYGQPAQQPVNYGAAPAGHAPQQAHGYLPQ
jgi:hypothetical protein